MYFNESMTLTMLSFAVPGQGTLYARTAHRCASPHIAVQWSLAAGLLSEKSENKTSAGKAGDLGPQINHSPAEVLEYNSKNVTMAHRFSGEENRWGFVRSERRKGIPVNRRTDRKAYLVLSDGTVFEGRRFGAEGDSTGELVFTTGMGGYVETLTDPSYYGQIIMQTFPLMGNYGIMEEDFEGECCCSGYVVREFTDQPSNFRCEYDLDTFLKNKGIPGIYGIDTRELTRMIRESGTMNAIICSDPPEDLSEVKAYEVRNAVKSVTCKEPYIVPAKGEKKYNVTLIDYGAKRNIPRMLAERGCEVKVVPSNTTASQILSEDPDGVMLSNGPGDPTENTACVGELKKLINKVPIFGICLGHQLMCLAFGGKTYKLKYGHRGVNQPATEIVDGETGRTFITTQNHGYAVDPDSLSDVGYQSFTNANDGTCEGMTYPDLSCFTVQFHPEAHAGPHDTGFLFDRFIKMMEEDKNA